MQAPQVVEFDFRIKEKSCVGHFLVLGQKYFIHFVFIYCESVANFQNVYMATHSYIIEFESACK